MQALCARISLAFSRVAGSWQLAGWVGRIESCEVRWSMRWRQWIGRSTLNRKKRRKYKYGGHRINYSWLTETIIIAVQGATQRYEC